VIGLGIELLLTVLWVVFAATQIVLPICRGTQLFPMVRRESELQRQRAEAAQELRERELKDEVDRLRAQARDRQAEEDIRERVRGIRLGSDEAEDSAEGAKR
jgi:hypothetical protein